MQDMQTITDLESRISAALDRIGQGLDRLPHFPPPAAEDAGTAALQEALEAERAAHAQLAERLQTLKDREATARAGLEAQIAELIRTRDQQTAELEGLRATVTQLRDTLAAQNGSAAEPQADNESLLAELEALRAERRAESAEMEAILSALVPLIEEPSHHA